MKFRSFMAFGTMVLLVLLTIRPSLAAQATNEAFSPRTSLFPIPNTTITIDPQSKVLSEQPVYQFAQKRKVRRIIGGMAAGAIIGGIIDGRRGARQGAVIGGVVGAVTKTKRPKYKKWRRGGSKRWRYRRIR